MAAQGRRWLATPPPGFDLPPRSAQIALAGDAQHFFSSDLGATYEDSICRSEVAEQTIRLTYMHTMQSWLMLNGPTFFVSPEICEACQQIDVLDHIEGVDLQTIHKFGYFSIPQGMGFRSNQTGDSIRHIWFAFFDEDKPLQVWLNGVRKFPVQAPGRRLFMQAYWDTSPDCSSYSLPLDIPGQSIMQSLNETRGDLTFGVISRDIGVDMLKAEAEDLGLWMGSLCANLCLLMQSYPQYISKMSTGKSHRQNFRDKPPPQSIIISRARTAAINPVVVERDSHEPVSSGEKRFMRGRRGHWRRQPHGDRFELTYPEVGIITLPDGRRAHMRLIAPWFNPDLFETKHS